MSPQDTAHVLTVAEAALLLRCSKAHLHNIVTGKVHSLPPLPVLRIGRRVVIRREALLRWMEWLEAHAPEPRRGSGLTLNRGKHPAGKAGG